MTPDSTNTTPGAGEKKSTRRRKKRVRSDSTSDKSKSGSTSDHSTDTKDTKQVDVGDIAGTGNAAPSPGVTASAQSTARDSKSAKRRTRKKPGAADKQLRETESNDASSEISDEAAANKSGRRRRSKRPSKPAAEPKPEPPAKTANERPGATQGDADRDGAAPGSGSPAAKSPGEKSTETDSSDARNRERPRRRRGRRGGRSAQRTAPTDQPAEKPSGRSALDSTPVSQSDDDLDEDLIEETEDAVEVGDETFPKPDLAERCKREMVINVTGGEECRIAILHEKRLEELFIERASSQSHVGNIYKGRVTNVESSIQAAFVDFGLSKNGFLHISDVQPQYFPDHKAEKEEVGRKIPRHHRPPIQKCFRRGQEVMVQITKEGVGTKGPTLTTYLSIPGRFLVMMPGMNRHGVSRKIEDEDERRKMKDVMSELTFPSGMGFILRTAGMGQNKRELQRDLNYLVRLWKQVVERVKKMPSPAELYRESDLVTRTIRDVYSVDFDRLIVDDPVAAKKAKEFFRIAMPRSKPRIEAYTDPQPIFHALGIEEEIERINARHVPLRSGGSLVVDSTEALVAIDVNSGRFRVPDDAEETALRINVEAADEIARQLRLRDLGGLIVCDFIDMRFDRNKRAVERALRDALKKHKERARILRMSAFGLIEMTRQRQGPSLKRNIYFDCPHCHGSGLVKMPESVILDVMRSVQVAAHHPEVRQIRVTVSTEVAYQILNTKRTAISTIESVTGKRVIIRGDLNFTSDQVECLCEDGRGQPVIVSGVESSTSAPVRPAPPR